MVLALGEDVVLALGEDVVLALEEDVVLALEEEVVLALEEDVAHKEGPWGSRHFGPCPEYLYQGCTIKHGVLTISADIGCFEQYRNGTYPTRPDKIN